MNFDSIIFPISLKHTKLIETKRAKKRTNKKGLCVSPPPKRKKELYIFHTKCCWSCYIKNNTQANAIEPGPMRVSFGLSFTPSLSLRDKSHERKTLQVNFLPTIFFCLQCSVLKIDFFSQFFFLLIFLHLIRCSAHNSLLYFHFLCFSEFSWRSRAHAFAVDIPLPCFYCVQIAGFESKCKIVAKPKWSARRCHRLIRIADALFVPFVLKSL